MSNNYKEVWNELHKQFKEDTNYVLHYDDWLERFDNIIADCDTEIIDLGCGVTGNNTVYLIEHGKKVVSCDFAEEALKVIEENIKDARTLLFDMLDGLPFDDNSRDLIIADLSLHYFSDKETKGIVSEIKRVLKPGGNLLFRVNSTNSTEYKKLKSNNTEEIEKNFFYANNMKKRFFDKEDLEKYFKDFSFEYVSEENMTRWNPDKIVWECAVKL